VAVALVLLVSKDPQQIWLVLAAIVIIGREIAISALREWMAEIGQRTKVAVSALGKYRDHPADRGPVPDAVPLGSAVPADVRARALAHGHCGRPDPDFDGRIPPRGLAGSATSRS
jgi:hypothetical protein